MDNLESEFEKRNPWVSQFMINEVKYGGNISFDNNPCITYFFDCFPTARTILDLGSLEGANTLQLAKKPGTEVVGIEGRNYNVEKSNFVKGLLEVNNVRYICANLENTPLTTFGKFDAVFCSGLLYHLPRPWELIEEISRISSKIFIWTHYAIEKSCTEEINGYEGCWYGEYGYKDPLSGLSEKSFWVSRASLIKMLEKYGFSHVNVYEDIKNHEHGAAIILGAWKD